MLASEGTVLVPPSGMTLCRLGNESTGERFA